MAAQGLLNALTIHRQVGNRRSEGFALENLAVVYRDTGRSAQSEAMLQQALAVHRAVNNRRNEGITSCEFALLQQALGRLSEARESWKNGTAILTSLKDVPEMKRLETTMRQDCAKVGRPTLDTP
jgi:tetratricopeptide (TPR) repeat protein